MLIALLLLLSFASIVFADSLGCLCDDYFPYQAKSWQGFYAIGDARLCPTDDPDDEYLATRLFRSVQEWILLEIQVDSKQEASFRIRVPNPSISDCHYFLIENSGMIVANINLTELGNNWYSVTAQFRPGELTDWYYLVWVEQ